MGTVVRLIVGASVLAAAPVLAQAPNPPTTPTPVEQRARYQMGTMESVLERAVEHAASVTRERLQSVVPSRMLLSERARARGFRIEPYGVFFDVIVPRVEGALSWSFLTLSQGNGLDSAIQELRELVEKTGDPEMRQALDLIELQVGPRRAVATSLEQRPARPGAPGPPASQSEPAIASPTVAPLIPLNPKASGDAILKDPDGAYRGEVIAALMDAMLDYSRGLDIAPEEWLEVGARRDDGARVALATGGEAPTTQIRISGADLRAYLGGQVSREETRKRMQVRVF